MTTQAIGLIVMTKSAKKPKQVRIYLNEENQQTLEEMASRMPELEESKLTTMLVSASLRAVREINYRFTFPIRLKFCELIEDENPRLALNEEKPEYRKARSTK